LAEHILGFSVTRGRKQRKEEKRRGPPKKKIKEDSHLLGRQSNIGEKRTKQTTHPSRESDLGPSKGGEKGASGLKEISGLKGVSLEFKERRRLGRTDKQHMRDADYARQQTRPPAKRERLEGGKDGCCKEKSVSA